MYMWILALLLFAKSVQCATNSNEKLQFVPSLPVGKPYSLTNEEDAWSLKGLSEIANGIALTLRSHPPYDIIGNILDKSFGKGGKSPSISEVIDYEVPLIVMASLALSAAIIIPIVGLIFCCCRCGGKCGGNVDDRKLKLHPTKERIAYSVGILLCAFFLILAGSFILASSVRMNDSIPRARTVWKDSFGDIQLYSDNTLEELYHIAVKEAIPTIGKLLNDVIGKYWREECKGEGKYGVKINHLHGEYTVNPQAGYLKEQGIIHVQFFVGQLTAAMAEDIVVPVLNQGAPLFESVFNSVLDCSQGITQSLVLLSEVESAVPSLVSVSSNIQRELQMAQKNLSDAVAQCKKDSGGGACDSLPEGNDLQTEANFTKVPNVTDTHKKVEDVSKTNLTDEVVKGNESVHNILHKVQNLTTNLTKDFQKFSEKIQNVDADVLKPLKNDINKYLQNSLYPLRDNVDDKYLGPNGMLSKYDKYRHVAFIVLGTLTLLDALLLIVAVILGQIGSTTYDTPSSRSNCTDWGGRLMIGAAGLFFFSAFLINLLLGILFLLGSNIAIVCDDLPDYKFLQKTIDDPKIMGEYILSKALFKDGNIPLTTSGILSDCSKNDAPWDAFKMDNLYNLSDVLSYKDKIPGIDKVFAELNSTITDTNVLSGEAKTTVNDSLNAGVHEINYTQFEEQVNKPIVKVSLQEFVSNLTKAAKEMKTVSQQASDLLSKTASRLQHLDTTEVNPAKQQAKSLGQLTRQLKEQGNVIVDSAQRVVEDGNKVAHFFKNDALAIAARGVTKHWNTVFGDVDYFLAFAINQVKFDVGRCKPLSSIYHGLTNTVCHHYTAGLNASWVAFGLCALVLLISIILCVRASKHFRRTRTISGNEDDPAPAGEIEMPWMDSAADKQNLIHT